MRNSWANTGSSSVLGFFDFRRHKFSSGSSHFLLRPSAFIHVISVVTKESGEGAPTKNPCSLIKGQHCASVSEAAWCHGIANFIQLYSSSKALLSELTSSLARSLCSACALILMGVVSSNLQALVLPLISP